MIIVLGMAGAGKSTLCERLANQNGYTWFSVGKYLRDHETGEQKAEMMRGKILDNSIVTPIVEKELNRLADSPEILLDGCPRTLEQALWLASQKTTPAVRCVLHFVVEDEEAIRRLMARGREDDNLEAMRLRIAGYHRDIGPVLAAFTDKNIPVVDIDANVTADAIFEQVVGVLHNL